MGEKKKTGAATYVGRILVSAVVLAASFMLGFYLGNLLTEWSQQNDYLQKGVPAFGVAMLIGLIRPVLVLFDLIVKFIKDGDAMKLWRPTIIFMATALTITLAFNLVEVTTRSGPEPQIVIWNGFRVLPEQVQAETPQDGPYAVFPVFFGQSASGFNSATRSFATGTTLGSAETQIIRSLVRGLLNCTGDSQQVRLKVRGFASSGGFAGVTPQQSQQLNLQAANARAEAVLNLIRQEAAGAPGLAAEAETWDSFETMQGAQALQDTIDGSFNSDLGNLSRRADILLEDPGSCGIRSSE